MSIYFFLYQDNDHKSHDSSLDIKTQNLKILIPVLISDRDSDDEENVRSDSKDIWGNDNWLLVFNIFIYVCHFIVGLLKTSLELLCI